MKKYSKIISILGDIFHVLVTVPVYVIGLLIAPVIVIPVILVFYRTEVGTWYWWICKKYHDKYLPIAEDQMVVWNRRISYKEREKLFRLFITLHKEFNKDGSVDRGKLRKVIGETTQEFPDVEPRHINLPGKV